jgi:hypothetical protein
MGHPGRERQNGTGRTGKTERDRQSRRDIMENSEQGRQNGTGITGKTGWGRQNRKDRTGQAELVFLLYRFEFIMFCDNFLL